MHGLATIRRLNGEPYLTVEEREAAARSAAAKPGRNPGQIIEGGADMAKPAEYPNGLDRSV